MGDLIIGRPSAKRYGLSINETSDTGWCGKKFHEFTTRSRKNVIDCSYVLILNAVHPLKVVAGDDIIDIREVKENAEKQGINLSEIALIYVGLTSDEKALLLELNLLKYENDDTVIATFTKSGDALFSEKIKGAHYLAA